MKSALKCFLLSVLTVSLVSCSVSNSSAPEKSLSTSAKQTPATYSEVENTAVTETKIKTFEDLFSERELTLEILKKGDEKVYKASTILNITIRDILQKSEMMDYNSFDSLNYDYKKYDYLLRFQGSNDILLSLEDNTFHMDGEKDLYKIWGDSRRFWESLIMDSATSKADLGKEPVDTLVKSYNEDVDGDGVKDDTNLAFIKSRTEDSNGKLVLKVNNSEIVIEKEISWVTFPYHVMGDPPSLKFLSRPDGKGNAIAVTYTWATNGVGSTGQIFMYDYKNGKFQSLDVKTPEMSFDYLGEASFKVSLPAINYSQIVKVNDTDTDFEKVTGENGRGIREMLKDRDSFWGHTLYYSVKDFNGDGRTELCSAELLRFQVPYLGLGTLYTIFRYNNGKIQPVKAIVKPPYNEKDRMLVVKEEVLDAVLMHGILDMDNKEIKNFWNVLSKNYGDKDMEKALNELIWDGHLKKQNNKITVDFQ